MDPNTERYHIIGHSLCPHVQRAVIVMAEHGIAYDRTDIDLDDKPHWLNSLSPTKKVPILIISEKHVLFESNVITEFLDEISPSSLHPVDIAEKAYHRSWVEFGTQILDCIARIIYRDRLLEDFELTLAEITKMLHLLEARVSGKTYFSPLGFHLIDIVYSTIFRYFNALALISKSGPFQDLPKIRRWRRALQARKSVQNAVPPNYDDLLVAFITTQDSYASDQLQSRMSYDKSK